MYFEQGLIMMILQIFALKNFLLLNYHFFYCIEESRNGYLQNIVPTSPL